MKIGKFAESNNLSIDTIRHYMELGLILPEKQGGQYYFDSRCQRDLEEIIQLKNMGFSLSEIKVIFFYKSFGSMTVYEEDAYYRTIFEEKFRKLEAEINRLTDIRDKLNAKLNSFSESALPNGNVTGINLSFISLFKCAKCHGPLVLADGTISNNQIIKGVLKCSCGETLRIEEGILVAMENLNSIEQQNSEIDPRYISDYINLTDATYLDNLLKGIEWSGRRLAGCDLKGKILLELGTGIGFFLRNVYKELPEDCVYIAVDHNIQRHRFLKSMLERSGINRNVIFMCTDFSDIPLKDKSVDMVLDISGTSNYSFEHEEFLLKMINPLLKDQSVLLGNYIIFKNFSSNSFIESRFRKNFNMRSIKEDILSLGFKQCEEKISEFLDKGGKYESYFVEGEKVGEYAFFGKR